MPQTSVAERIKILVETVASKSAEFLQATGLTYQNLHDLTSGRSAGPSFATTTKILSAYPRVSERWFLFGEGEMMKPVPDEDTGTKNSDVCEPDKAPRARDMAVPVSPSFLRGDEIQRPGMPSMNYLTPGNPPKKVGLDLVEQIATNTQAIQELREAISRIEQQLK